MFIQRFCKRKEALVGLIVLVFVGLAAIVGPVLYHVDPWGLITGPLVWPGSEAQVPLGSDNMGRDVLAGLLSGARVSLMVGIAAAVGSVLIGVLVGAVSGYFPGWTDDVLMRVTEVFQTIPSFILVLVLVAIFRPSLAVVILSITVVSWPPIARLVRGEFLSLRKRPYVEACVLMGMGRARIIFTQILPNCAAPIIVTGSIMVASAILIEAGLAFLGLQDPSVMSWGVMIGNGKASLRTAWYLVAIPGFAIMLTVLAVSLVADGINDAANPRSANG
jgi:peptide/nickel transport system permease protein